MDSLTGSAWWWWSEACRRGAVRRPEERAAWRAMQAPRWRMACISEEGVCFFGREGDVDGRD